MTQEEKQLLLIDLCARLPYGVHITWDGKNDIQITPSIYNAIWLEHDFEWKSYLRPMSSMTEEEKKEFNKVVFESQNINGISASTYVSDWLISKQFDVRGLIPKGIALEAPEGMYDI